MRARLVPCLLAAGALMASLVPGVAAGGPPATASGEETRPGGPALRDPYFPDDGNRGYDVRRYDVRLSYNPANYRIRARTTVRATAKQALDRFHLDLVRLDVLRVTVDGRRARFARRQAHELVIIPKRTVRKGAKFATTVTYRGRPGRDPLDHTNGWYRGRTPGSSLALGEPHSCTLWFPCNDHPTDKAKFKVTTTVPRPFEVVSIGKKLRTTKRQRPDGTRVRTFRWQLSEPTATYLTTLYIDKLQMRRYRLANGTQVINAYGPTSQRAMKMHAQLPEVLRVLTRRWGRYPAPSAGGIFVDSPDLGYALETFTRSVYPDGVGLLTVVHENGHQWWGDNITLKRWRDICFNECLASYSEWLWLEHEGRNLDRVYRNGVRRNGSMFRGKLYDMGPDHLFDSPVYYKGKFFVHALRNKIGDRAFFVAMRAIQRDRAVGNMSMIELRNQLERRTGVGLHSFWREWVLETGRPSRANLYPGDLGGR